MCKEEPIHDGLAIQLEDPEDLADLVEGPMVGAALDGGPIHREALVDELEVPLLEVLRSRVSGLLQEPEGREVPHVLALALAFAIPLALALALVVVVPRGGRRRHPEVLRHIPAIAAKLRPLRILRATLVMRRGMMGHTRALSCCGGPCGGVEGLLLVGALNLVEREALVVRLLMSLAAEHRPEVLDVDRLHRGPERARE